MKKALLSLQEITEMFNLRTFLGLLSNAEKAIHNLDESEEPINKLSYIFRVLASYCEKVSINLDAYKRAYEKISLSDPRQQALFMSFCYVIGITDNQELRLNTLSREDLEKFNKKIKAAKKTYSKLFEINYETYRDLKSIKENHLNYFELEKRVHKVYDLVERSSEDEALKDVCSLLLEAVRFFQKNEALLNIAKQTNVICGKSEILVNDLHSKQKANFYTGQLEYCVYIIQELYNMYFMSSRGDAEFSITKHLMDLTVELMDRYYDQIEKEHSGQDRFVFAKRSSLGKMDKRETIYLENVRQCFEEMKKGGRIEKPNLEDLPSMVEYTQVLGQFLDWLNTSSLLGDKKPSLSP